MNQQQGLITCSVAIPVEAPERVLIFPWGETGRVDRDITYVVNDKSIAEVIAAFASRGVDLPFDYEHQVEGGEFKSPDGRAPAAGWIKKLEVVRGEGIYANVEWTRTAAKHIAEKEYRYVSPAFWFAEDDKHVTEITSVALTNKPALRGMKPVVAKQEPSAAGREDVIKETSMKLIREALGLADGADEATCVGAINKLSGFRAAACKAIDVKPEATDESIVSGISGLKTSHATATASANSQIEVLSTRLKSTVDELAALKGTLNQQASDGRIKAALSQGKITQAELAEGSKDRDFLMNLARDGAQWDAFMSRIPSRAPADGRVLSDTATTGGAIEGGRPGVIHAACRELDQSRGIACTKAQYVDEYLRENKMPKLTKDETEKLPV